jgi:hypothetical protein
MFAESETAVTRPVLCALILAAFTLPFVTRAQDSQQSSPDDTTVKVLRGDAGTSPLPRPESVAIFDFVVPAEVVTVDESVAGRLQQRRALRKGIDVTSPEAIAAHVQLVFSNDLAQDLGKLPMPVRRAFTGAATPRGTLVIRGEFTGITQGNATQRIMVGFGRGASSVRANVTVLLIGVRGPILVSEFQLSFASGKKPGAVATMGVGSLAVGTAAGGVTDKNSSVDADAARMAKGVAKVIAKLMGDRKWVPEPKPDPLQTGAAPPSPSSQAVH